MTLWFTRKMAWFWSVRLCVLCKAAWFWPVRPPVHCKTALSWRGYSVFIVKQLVLDETDRAFTVKRHVPHHWHHARISCERHGFGQRGRPFTPKRHALGKECRVVTVKQQPLDECVLRLLWNGTPATLPTPCTHTSCKRHSLNPPKKSLVWILLLFYVLVALCPGSMSDICRTILVCPWCVAWFLSPFNLIQFTCTLEVYKRPVKR